MKFSKFPLPVSASDTVGVRLFSFRFLDGFTVMALSSFSPRSFIPNKVRPEVEAFDDSVRIRGRLGASGDTNGERSMRLPLSESIDALPVGHRKLSPSPWSDLYVTKMCKGGEKEEYVKIQNNLSFS